jgi:hypothetical protein
MVSQKKSVSRIVEDYNEHGGQKRSRAFRVGTAVTTACGIALDIPAGCPPPGRSCWCQRKLLSTRLMFSQPMDALGV